MGLLKVGSVQAQGKEARWKGRGFDESGFGPKKFEESGSPGHRDD